MQDQEPQGLGPLLPGCRKATSGHLVSPYFWECPGSSDEGDRPIPESFSSWEPQVRASRTKSKQKNGGSIGWLSLSVHRGGGHLGGTAPRGHKGQAILTVADRQKEKQARTKSRFNLQRQITYFLKLGPTSQKIHNLQNNAQDWAFKVQIRGECFLFKPQFQRINLGGTNLQSITSWWQIRCF